MALVQSIIDSLAAIAAGDVGFVAMAVENAIGWAFASGKKGCAGTHWLPGFFIGLG